MKKIWNYIISVDLCLMLLAFVCLAMAAGSFLLTGEYAAAINGMPLLAWLREVPPKISWWLWLTVAFLALLALNTVFCSFDTLRTRWNRAGALPLIAPQLIHAGFLLIMAAHLLSALGGYNQHLEVVEGSVARLPDGRLFGVAALNVNGTPGMMPSSFSGELATDLRNPRALQTISPNHPWLSGGYGVYIKYAENSPFKRALLEIHREPGAGMALTGAIFFTFGNVLLLYLRSKSRE